MRRPGARQLAPRITRVMLSRLRPNHGDTPASCCSTATASHRDRGEVRPATVDNDLTRFEGAREPMTVRSTLLASFYVAREPVCGVLVRVGTVARESAENVIFGYQCWHQPWVVT